MTPDSRASDDKPLGLPAISHTAVLTIVLELAAMALAYVSQVALARWLGPTEYGRYAFVVSFSVLLMVPLQLGLDVGLLRFVPQYRATRDHSRAAGFLRVAFLLPVSLAGLAGLTLCGLGIAVGPTRWEYASAFAVGAFTLPLLVASSLAIHAGRAFGRLITLKSAYDVLRPLILLGGAGLLVWLGVRMTGARVLGVVIIALLVTVGVQALALRKTLTGTLGQAEPRYETAFWIKHCVPFLMTTGTAVIMQQSDVLMIGLFNSPQDVGVYAVAVRLGKLVTLTLVGVNMLAAPAYAALYARRDFTGMQRLASTLAHWVFWPGLLIATGLALFGTSLLGWFGSSFTRGYPVLMLLAIAGLVDIGVGSVGYIANMADQQWAAARIRLVAATVNIALNAVLIPAYGLLGAASATALSIALANLWTHRMIAARLGVRPSIWSALRHR